MIVFPRNLNISFSSKGGKTIGVAVALNIILKRFMNTDSVNTALIVPGLILNPVPSYNESGNIKLNISLIVKEWYSAYKKNQETNGAFLVDPVLESNAKAFINIFDDAYRNGAKCSDIIIHFLQDYHTMLHPDSFLNATLYLLEKNSADLAFIEQIDDIGLFSVNYDDKSFTVSRKAYKFYLEELENLINQFHEFTSLNTVSTVSNNNSDSNEPPYEPTLQEFQTLHKGKNDIIKKAIDAIRTRSTVPPSQEAPIPSSSPSLTPSEVTVYHIPVPDPGVNSLPSAPCPGFSSSGFDNTFTFDDKSTNLSIIVLTITSFVSRISRYY